MNKRDRSHTRAVDTSEGTTDRQNAGWQRPPFEPGHTLSLRHGAYSERAIQAKADAIRDQLYTVAPWLDADKDVLAVARFLRVEARCRLLHAAIEEQAVERGPARVSTRLHEQAIASDRLAAQLGGSLGLDPLGRAKLQRQAASAVEAEATIADLTAEGRRVRLAAEQRIVDAEVIDEDDEDVTPARPRRRKARVKGKAKR